MPEPKPLFSSMRSVFRRRKSSFNPVDSSDALTAGYGSDGHSTDSEDEDYVERSLPPSPADAHFGYSSARDSGSQTKGPYQGASWNSNGNAEAGPSRAMRFALEDEAVMRYAAGAFSEGVTYGSGVGGHEHGGNGYEADSGGMRRPQSEEPLQPSQGYAVVEEVKPDLYDSDDELRPIRPEEEEYAAHPSHTRVDIANDAITAADAGGMRYRPGRTRADDARRTLEAQIAAEAEEDALQDADEDEEEIPTPDERQCRICFGGREEEESMGRLISPCLCTGSMRFVHVQCINAWRGTGTNAKAFMECPQCHHRYQLRRTLVSGLATSRPLLLLLSSILFFLLAISTGHIVHRFLLSPSSSSSSSKTLTRKQLPTRNPFSLFDYFQEDWDWDDGFGGGGMVIIGGGGGAGSGTLIYDMVLAAVDTFSAVAEKFAVAYGSKSSGSGLDWLFFALAIRFLLGLAILGSLSFLSLLLSLSLFAPFQLANGLRGTGLFNSLNRRARGVANGARAGGAAGGGGTPAGQLMIIIFVLVGAANTISQVYRLVAAVTQRALKYLETQILEVNPEDRRRARQQTRENRRIRRGKWYRVWWREKRWATRQGWEEVRVRLYMAARAGLAPIWDRLGVQGHDDAQEGPGRGRARGLMIE